MFSNRCKPFENIFLCVWVAENLCRKAGWVKKNKNGLACSEMRRGGCKAFLGGFVLLAKSLTPATPHTFLFFLCGWVAENLCRKLVPKIDKILNSKGNAPPREATQGLARGWQARWLGNARSGARLPLRGGLGARRGKGAHYYRSAGEHRYAPKYSTPPKTAPPVGV